MIARALLAALYVTSSFSSHHIHHELEGRIVNGIPTSANSYPWMVSLRQYVIGITNAFCGGALIDTDPPIVLTAAHCLEDFRYNASDGTIRDKKNRINDLYADINRTYPEDIIPGDKFETLPISISEIHLHPKWNGSALDGNDVALIIFNDNNQTVDITIDPLPTIQPKLSIATPCCTVGEPLITIGYGQNAENGVGTFSLERTTLNYVSTLDCALAILAAANVTIPNAREVLQQSILDDPDESIMCVMGNDTNVCYGDSGGPIFRYINGSKPEIIGVASFTIDGCNNGYPSGYTSVAHYHDWIMKFIAFEADGISFPPTMDPTTNPSTTNYPTTAMPTTAMPTRAMPTTAMPTTAMTTSATPTTAIPTTGYSEPESANSLFCFYAIIIAAIFSLSM